MTVFDSYADWYNVKTDLYQPEEFWTGANWVHAWLNLTHFCDSKWLMCSVWRNLSPYMMSHFQSQISPYFSDLLKYLSIFLPLAWFWVAKMARKIIYSNHMSFYRRSNHEYAQLTANDMLSISKYQLSITIQIYLWICVAIIPMIQRQPSWNTNTSWNCHQLFVFSRCIIATQMHKKFK